MSVQEMVGGILRISAEATALHIPPDSPKSLTELVPREGLSKNQSKGRIIFWSLSSCLCKALLEGEGSLSRTETTTVNRTSISSKKYL